MCGIFGIVTQTQQILGPTLIEAGYRLSYRGYDSVGCATLNDGQIDLRKDVGKVGEVAGRLSIAEMFGSRGILQLRWATFGAPSQVNSQPHLDSRGDMVGAHNGNVVNNVELRQLFTSEGMLVRSENDGESCVHAVERYLNQGASVSQAIQQAAELLAGDYAYVFGRSSEDCLYAVKAGSGLVIGIGEDFTCVSSDLPSILPLTRRVVRVYDGEFVILWANQIELRKIADGSLIERDIEVITENMDAAQKGGFPHFMLKEINEQPDVAAHLLNLLDHSPAVDQIAKKLKTARRIYLVGCGTSYHACMLGAVYLARQAGLAAIPILAPQFIAQYGPAIGPQDVGIFVSQSGETKDVLNAVEVAAQKGMAIYAMVNVVGSALTLVSQAYLPLGCGYEISVPATKTYSNQALAFLYLAMRAGGRPTHTLAGLPGLMEETINLAEPQVLALEPELASADDLYCLGYGLTYAIALEGALKLKEITYAHCEGMLSTEFKHGPLSAIQDDFPVIFVAGPEDIPLIVSGINEVTCRGGRAIAIGGNNASLHANASDLIAIPDASPELMALLAVLPLQLMSYHMSVRRGYDPDFPRNLSKTLTVD